MLRRVRCSLIQRGWPAGSVRLWMSARHLLIHDDGKIEVWEEAPLTWRRQRPSDLLLRIDRERIELEQADGATRSTHDRPATEEERCQAALMETRLREMGLVEIIAARTAEQIGWRSVLNTIAVDPTLEGADGQWHDRSIVLIPPVAKALLAVIDDRGVRPELWPSAARAFEVLIHEGIESLDPAPEYCERDLMTYHLTGHGFSTHEAIIQRNVAWAYAPVARAIATDLGIADDLAAFLRWAERQNASVDRVGYRLYASFAAAFGQVVTTVAAITNTAVRDVDRSLVGPDGTVGALRRCCAVLGSPLDPTASAEQWFCDPVHAWLTGGMADVQEATLSRHARSRAHTVRSSTRWGRRMGSAMIDRLSTVSAVSPPRGDALGH